MLSGLLLMMLMIVIPGLVMVVLGNGLLTWQLLRGMRLLATLAALLIFYKLIIQHGYRLAHALYWLGVAFALVIYSLFAVKLKHLISKSVR